MKHEKSCGAVVYRMVKGRIELLLIKHRYGGHWSFPKGHVERGEQEFETALREVKEETGLDIRLEKGFRHSVEYYPRPDVRKQVVYFLGEAACGDFQMQEEEISDIVWVELEKAYHMVSFRNDKNLINQAKALLRSPPVPRRYSPPYYY